MTDLPESQRRMRALQDALELYLAQGAGTTSRAQHEMLQDNPELRELLEPMLRGDQSLLGTRVPDFRVLQRIGRGGMGEVFEAEQLSLHRRVALKMLRATDVGSPDAILRLCREAEIAAGLEHPGIVKVHASGIAGGDAWLAMERIDGPSLGEAIDAIRAGTRARSTLELVRIGAEVAEALGYAHARGVVHRDVKPSNVLLRADGSAVLTDFGLARAQEASPLSRSGDVVGTPHYMAPEQARGLSNEVTARSDVFSLGAMLYELLTLVRPFEGKSAIEIAERIVRAEPASPELLNAELPNDLVAIVLKALEKEPERRYANGGELAADLRAFLEYRPVAARRATRLERFWRWRRREPVKAALLFVLAIGVPMLFGLGGYLIANAKTIAVGATAMREHELDRLLELGFRDYYFGEDRPAAVESLQAALALDPECEEALGGLALMAAHERGPQAALDLLASHPTSHRSLQRLAARNLRELGRTAEADALAASAGEPESAIDLFIAGTQELVARSSGASSGSKRAADLLLRSVLASDRPRRHLHMQWARAVAVSNQVELLPVVEAVMMRHWPDESFAWIVAVDALHRIDPGRALQMAEAGVQRFPAEYDLWSLLAVCRVGVEDWRGADAALLRSIELRPTKRISHWLRVKYLMQGGDLARAEPALRELMRLDRDHPRTRALQGRMVYLRGDRKRAIEILRGVVAQDPGFVDAWFWLGVALASVPDPDGTLAAFTKVVELDPLSLRGHVNLASWHANLGHDDEAARAFQRAIEIRPSHPLAWRRLATFYDSRGDSTLLAKHLEAWEQRLPDDPVLAGHRVRIAAETDPAAALAMAQRAVEAGDGKDAFRLLTLAKAQEASGDLDAARATLARAQAVLAEHGERTEETGAALQELARHLGRAPEPSAGAQK